MRERSRSLLTLLGAPIFGLLLWGCDLNPQPLPPGAQNTSGNASDAAVAVSDDGGAFGGNGDGSGATAGSSPDAAGGGATDTGAPPLTDGGVSDATLGDGSSDASADARSDAPADHDGAPDDATTGAD